MVQFPRRTLQLLSVTLVLILSISLSYKMMSYSRAEFIDDAFEDQDRSCRSDDCQWLSSELQSTAPYQLHLLLNSILHVYGVSMALFNVQRLHCAESKS